MADFIDYYNKYGFKKIVLNDSPSPNLGLIVVIPCHNETNAIETLESLRNCLSIQCDLEIIIIINSSENDCKEVKETNNRINVEVKNWKENINLKSLRIHQILLNNLPAKHAGVGLARKIGMDLAAERLFSIGNPTAPIVCYDADSSCEENYLVEIKKHFEINKGISACSIYFEHPIHGEEHSEEIYKAIALYELHLRYYRHGLAYAKAPFAFHTIGSSMAVRAEDYCKQGGMNKRKAGEDFYFLQKFIELGSFSELNTTKVIPSPRASDRVPFGTGRAVGQHITQQKDIGRSYDPKSFLILRTFFEGIPSFYEDVFENIPYEVTHFIGDKSILLNEIKKIKQQSSSYAAFRKRFFRWFNAFKTLKFIHFLREEGLEEMPVQRAAQVLEKWMEKNNKGEGNEVLEILQRYREYDRNFSSSQIFSVGSTD